MRRDPVNVAVTDHRRQLTGRDEYSPGFQRTHCDPFLQLTLHRRIWADATGLDPGLI
jgi:hypothetical protein